MQKLSGTFFDEFAETFDTFYDGKRGRAMQWIDMHFRRDMFVRFGMTFELLGDLQGRTVLDVGCGSGPYMAEAFRRGAGQITGIDPAPGMLDLARERLEGIGKLDQTQFIKGYFPEQRPADVHDSAIVMGVMDYVRDAPSFVKGLLESVSRRAVLSFPSTHWFRTPVRKVRYRLRNCPLYIYDENHIHALMEEVDAPSYSVYKIEGAGMDYVVCIENQKA